jgi:hypothetical protein
LVRASERGMQLEMIAALNRLLAVLVEHRDRSGDDALCERSRA